MIRLTALIPVVAVAYGFQQYRQHSRIDRALLRLKSSGFRIKYRLDGSVLVVVDDTSRRIAFVFGAGSQVHDLDALQQCDWLRTGPRGPRSSNTIQFTFKDAQKAPVLVRGLDEAEAEQWMERFDVLMSGW
jgi:hypothetical protein